MQVQHLPFPYRLMLRLGFSKKFVRRTIDATPKWFISHGVALSLWVASDVNGYGWRLSTLSFTTVAILFMWDMKNEFRKARDVFREYKQKGEIDPDEFEKQFRGRF